MKPPTNPDVDKVEATLVGAQLGTSDDLIKLKTLAEVSEHRRRGMLRDGSIRSSLARILHNRVWCRDILTQLPHPPLLPRGPGALTDSSRWAIELYCLLP